METKRNFEVTGVDYVAVPTADAEKAAEFYREVLGLERSKQWGDMPAYEFETGSQTIAVMQRRLRDRFLPERGADRATRG